MRKHLSLTILFLLSVSVLTSFISVNTSATVPGDLIFPGTELSGSLTDANPQDSWGIQINQVGTYNFTVTSTNGSVQVAIYRYIFGWILTNVQSLVSNATTTVVALPGPEVLSGLRTSTYMIRVVRSSSLETPDYVVNFEYIDEFDIGVLQTSETKTFNLTDQSFTSEWLTFNATGVHNAYNITWSQNTSQVIYLDLYTELGSIVYDRSTSSNNTSNLVLLDPGTYYFEIQHSSSSPVKMWMTATPYNMTVFRPGDTVQMYMNDPDPAANEFLFQLILEEGKFYDIQMNVESTLNGGFFVYKGPVDTGTSIASSMWGTGLGENLTDVVFWGQYAMYTQWDLNMTGNYSKTLAVYNTGWEGDLVDHSRLVLRLFSVSGFGDVTFTISNGTDVPTLKPGDAIARTYNNTIGPLWQLYRVTDLTPASGYELALDHSSAAGKNFTTEYDFYQPIWSDSYDIYTYQPFYSSDVWDLLTNEKEVLFSEDWDDYGDNENRTNLFFHSPAGDRWLLIRVRDAVQAGSPTGIPFMEGTLNITLAERAPHQISVGTPLIIVPENDDPLILRALIIPGHHYQLSVTATNFSNNPGFPSLLPQVYDSVGLSLDPYVTVDWFLSPQANNPSTLYTFFQAVTPGPEITIIMPTNGEGPLEILLTDVTFADVVLEGGMLIIGSLLGAAIVGVVMGLFLGKWRYSR
jgi:hypothetical protein